MCSVNAAVGRVPSSSKNFSNSPALTAMRLIWWMASGDSNNPQWLTSSGGRGCRTSPDRGNLSSCTSMRIISEVCARSLRTSVAFDIPAGWGNAVLPRLNSEQRLLIRPVPCQIPVVPTVLGKEVHVVKQLEQLAVGGWQSGSEQWAVSSEQWAVSSEQWAVSSEQWAVSSEQWAVSSEQWFRKKGNKLLLI